MVRRHNRTKMVRLYDSMLRNSGINGPIRLGRDQRVLYNPLPFFEACNYWIVRPPQRAIMPHRRDAFWLLWIALWAAASGGCSGLMRPYDFWQPGDVRHQRSVAISHDPYTLDDLGPPVLGGRPRAFEKPLSEVQRAQLYNPPLRPLRPLPTFQPTVVGPPAAVNPFPAPPPVQTIPAPYPAPPPR